METSVCIDWLTITAPAESHGWLRHRLCKLFGDSFVPKGASGFFGDSEQHGAGFRLCAEHNNTGRSMVSLSGSTLREVAHEEVLALLADCVSKGLRITRLDVAVDFRGDRVRLVDHVVRACQRGRLSGLRRVRFHSGMARLGVLDNHGVSLGTRGSDGSGRFVRVYDKGLETKTEEQGRWVRFEAELTGDCSQQAADLAAALIEQEREANGGRIDGSAAWGCLGGCALGSVDFLIRKDRNLSRARRAAWWSRYCGAMQTVRLRRAFVPRRVEQTVEWLQNTVSRVVRGLVEGANIPFSDLLQPFEVEPFATTLRRARAYLQVERLGTGPVPEFVPG